MTATIAVYGLLAAVVLAFGVALLRPALWRSGSGPGAVRHGCPYFEGPAETMPDLFGALVASTYDRVVRRAGRCPLLNGGTCGGDCV